MNKTAYTHSALQHGGLATAAIAAIALMAFDPDVHAYGTFGSADSRQKQVFCDMSVIQGHFSSTESRYTASGVCVQLDSLVRGQPNGGVKTSEFPDINQSKELFRAAWTAQGSYNPVTKETWEKVTMPAPNVDQKSPVGRPYGNYESRMICATDPWLTGIGVNCTGRTVSATGNLGDMVAALRQLNRPATTPNKLSLLQALNESHDRYVRTRSPTSTTAATSKRSVLAAVFAPAIVEPKPGSTHRPQTAMSIRVTPAKNAKDTSYELEIQVQANFDWRALTNIPVNAAAAQSALGYKGWGVHVDGTGTQMMAVDGVYRVRALATAPSRSAPGDWVEFKIDGKPGVTKDVLVQSKAATTDGVRSAVNPQAAQSATATANKKASSVSLNPQPLPPKPADPALTKATVQSPLASAKSKADAVSLNPQPLPPASPTVLPMQAPSAFR